MIKRVVLAGVIVLALMIAVKDGRILRDTGLTGMCSVAEVLPDGTQIEACSSGKLAGRPDLSRHGCRVAALTDAYQYWRCPAAIASGNSH